MSYFLRIFYPDHIKDYPLGQSLTIGRGGQLSIPEMASTIRLRKVDDGYTAAGLSGNSILKDGSFLPITKNINGLLLQEEFRELAVIKIDAVSNIMIGRHPDCQLKLPSRPSVPSDMAGVARRHVRLQRSGKDWIVEPVKAEAKVYINGKLVEGQASMKNGDILCLGKYSIRIKENQFSASVASVLVDQTSVKDDPPQASPKTSGFEPEPPLTDKPEEIFIPPTHQSPVFNRGPHSQKQIPGYELVLPVKERMGDKPEMNWVGTLLPPVVMLVVMLGIYVLTGNATTLYYTVPMYGVSMIVALTNYQSQKKRFEARRNAAETNFQRALEEQQEKVDQIKREQREILEDEYPSMQDCLSIVKQRSSRLWRRRPDESGFMELRLGTGKVSTKIQVRQNSQAEGCSDLINCAQVIKNAPVNCPVGRFQNVGLVGSRGKILKMMKNLVVQAAVNHSYEEVGIAAIFPEEEQDEWAWMRWLPHVFSEDRQQRYLACENGDVIRLCRNFEEVLQKRFQPAGRSREKEAHIFFIIGDCGRAAHQHLMEYLNSVNPGLNVSSVFLAHSRSELPGCCQAVIETDLTGSGKWYSIHDSGTVYDFQMDELPDSNYEELARSMAPLRLPAGAWKEQFPSCITFLEGYHVKRVKDLNIEERWKKGRPEISMAVPVGVKQNGDPFYFDIHQKAHGPHGMAAGQARSGKSEMVQSWLLSMALHFSPEEVSFVLVDYKGDGLLKPFRNLPHLVGTISDLDHNIGRNVIALEKEVIRRQELFRVSGAHDIIDYKLKYRNREVSEPLPYLIIVIDEFADFKTQHPEFMDIIDQIYTKGGSSGIQIMILAQDPTMAITPKIAANSRYRWCMQVATNEASRGMLDTSDAYTMSKLPGRGFIKVGNFEVYEIIQSFWSGASYHSGARSVTRIPSVAQVGLNGTRSVSANREKTMGFWSSEKEIDKVVSYINAYVKQKQIPLPEQVWSPPLGKTILLDDIFGRLYKIFDGKSWPEQDQFNLVAGMVDDPGQQVQYPLTFHLKESGHISVQGGPGSGKTAFLVTAVVSLAKCYSPEEIKFYLFDYDKWSLNLLQGLPHTVGVCNGEAGEELEKLVGIISAEISRRKLMFSKAGVSSFESYCTLVQKIPMQFVIVDGISNAWDDSMMLQEMLQEVAMKGVGYGIYLIVSAPGTGFPYKLIPFFKTRLTLNQNDPSDYVGIVGRGLEPEKYPGRGLANWDHLVEFQTALPVKGKTEVERNREIRILEEEMQSAWEDISISHTQVDGDSQKVSDGQGKVFIGVDSILSQPVEVSFEKKHCLLISAIEEQKRVELLQIICQQLLNKENTEVIIFDDERGNMNSYRQKAAAWFAAGNSASDQYLADLMPELARRQEEKEQSPDQEFPLIVLVIAELKEFFMAADDDTIPCLKDIVVLGRNLGIYFIAAGQAEGIAYLGEKGEKLTSALLRQRHAILLGGSFADHRVFEASMSYTESSKALGPGESYYLTDKKVNKIWRQKN